jgi:hydrogenase maturation protein HypF
LISWKSVVEAILIDLQNQCALDLIAYKFHLWCTDVICSLTNLSRKTQVILSGGVFQNKLLTELVFQKLNNQKRQIFYPEKIPPNDSGLAVGQIWALNTLGSNPLGKD